ncbi:DUF4145 domain-containing protein [Leptospira bandrabouensis]|uniref:DUF4145 domain-containing protein n=1 Tax=Leptospira bandrabouensis TaxID=2484903 RepID=UPI001EE92AA0|nr:DUF4145 domain-containing protein [Leptospira bandrabouensis]MCG6146593.1 DUF4145 domain-containing protein [Leptospira bandrabouensis]MCG6161968.1 DUF4145 domain-containing protein [Leptospira bandrabouensis]MCG6166176.1 DUF4145 domain-containing protein [Leptospira bandrabouensis]
MRLENILMLERCPHCNVDKPNIRRLHLLKTSDGNGTLTRVWGIYSCERCGGVITAAAYGDGQGIIELFPKSKNVDKELPDRAKSYLEQAINSLSAPAGSVMLTASCVDSMLKEKGYKEGTLFQRINKAAEEHLITKEMAKWAHEIRLDANDQRHSDYDRPLPTIDDAKKLIDFAQTLGLILFALPDRVSKGLEQAKKQTENK